MAVSIQNIHASETFLQVFSIPGIFNNVYIYHIANDNWLDDNANNLPKPFMKAITIPLGEGNKHYLLGGTTNPNKVMNEDVLIYDPAKPNAPSPWVSAGTVTRGCFHTLPYKAKIHVP